MFDIIIYKDITLKKIHLKTIRIDEHQDFANIKAVLLTVCGYRAEDIMYVSFLVGEKNNKKRYEVTQNELVDKEGNKYTFKDIVSHNVTIRFVAVFIPTVMPLFEWSHPEHVLEIKPEQMTLQFILDSLAREKEVSALHPPKSPENNEEASLNQDLNKPNIEQISSVQKNPLENVLRTAMGVKRRNVAVAEIERFMEEASRIRKEHEEFLRLFAEESARRREESNRILKKQEEALRLWNEESAKQCEESERKKAEYDEAIRLQEEKSRLLRESSVRLNEEFNRLKEEENRLKQEYELMTAEAIRRSKEACSNSKDLIRKSDEAMSKSRVMHENVQLPMEVSGNAEEKMPKLDVVSPPSLTSNLDNSSQANFKSQQQQQFTSETADISAKMARLHSMLNKLTSDKTSPYPSDLLGQISQFIDFIKYHSIHFDLASDPAQLQKLIDLKNNLTIIMQLCVVLSARGIFRYSFTSNQLSEFIETINHLNKHNNKISVHGGKSDLFRGDQQAGINRKVNYAQSLMPISWIIDGCAVYLNHLDIHVSVPHKVCLNREIFDLDIHISNYYYFRENDLNKVLAILSDIRQKLMRTNNALIYIPAMDQYFRKLALFGIVYIKNLGNETVIRQQFDCKHFVNLLSQMSEVIDFAYRYSMSDDNFLENRIVMLKMISVYLRYILLPIIRKEHDDSIVSFNINPDKLRDNLIETQCNTEELWEIIKKILQANAPKIPLMDEPEYFPLLRGLKKTLENIAILTDAPISKIVKCDLNVNDLNNTILELSIVDFVAQTYSQESNNDQKLNQLGKNIATNNQSVYPRAYMLSNTQIPITDDTKDFDASTDDQIATEIATSDKTKFSTAMKVLGIHSSSMQPNKSRFDEPVAEYISVSERDESGCKSPFASTVPSDEINRKTFRTRTP